MSYDLRFFGFIFSSRRRHTRCALVTEFRRVLFRSLRPRGRLQPFPTSAAPQPRRSAAAADAGNRAASGAGSRALAGPLRASGAAARLTAGRRHHGAPPPDGGIRRAHGRRRSEEHTSELQSLMRNWYAVFGLKKKTTKKRH